MIRGIVWSSASLKAIAFAGVMPSLVVYSASAQESTTLAFALAFRARGVTALLSVGGRVCVYG